MGTGAVCQQHCKRCFRGPQGRHLDCNRSRCLASPPDYATASGRKAELERSSKEDPEATKRDDEWTHYHQGNGLSTNKVWAVLPEGNDVWFSTANGMELYKDADYQLVAFYEKLLPILNIPDLYHLFGGMTVPVADRFL